MFKHIVSIFGEPDIDLFPSRINNPERNNPESPIEYTARQSSSYSSDTLLDHTELVPGTLGDAGRPPSNNDSLIEHIVSPYLCTQQHLTLCIPSLKKLLVAQITGETSSHKIFLQQPNIYSCPLEENQPEDDITRCCNSGITVGERKPLICYHI